MQRNILICGVGGQGIVLTGKLISAAAMARGIPVMSAETIGMAQKGGSVFTFLRLGDDLHCPMFPEKSADIIERHMWPGGHSKAPNSLEGVIVSAADKYAAIKDLVQGSELRHTGVKNYIRNRIGKQR